MVQFEDIVVHNRNIGAPNPLITDAKSHHHFTAKSVAKLPYNCRIWKKLLKAHFQQFVAVFGNCSISKTMFKKKNR